MQKLFNYFVKPSINNVGNCTEFYDPGVTIPINELTSYGYIRELSNNIPISSIYQLTYKYYDSDIIQFNINQFGDWQNKREKRRNLQKIMTQIIVPSIFKKCPSLQRSTPALSLKFYPSFIAAHRIMKKDQDSYVEPVRGLESEWIDLMVPMDAGDAGSQINQSMVIRNNPNRHGLRWKGKCNQEIIPINYHTDTYHWVMWTMEAEDEGYVAIYGIFDTGSAYIRLTTTDRKLLGVSDNDWEVSHNGKHSTAIRAYGGAHLVGWSEESTNTGIHNVNIMGKEFVEDRFIVIMKDNKVYFFRKSVFGKIKAICFFWRELAVIFLFIFLCGVVAGFFVKCLSFIDCVICVYLN